MRRKEGLPTINALVPIMIYTDSGGLVDAAHNIKTVKDVKAQRRRDIAMIKECIQNGEIRALLHIDGLFNPSDCLTKDYSLCIKTRQILTTLLKTGKYSPTFKKG